MPAKRTTSNYEDLRIMIAPTTASVVAEQVRRRALRYLHRRVQDPASPFVQSDVQLIAEHLGLDDLDLEERSA